MNKDQIKKLIQEKTSEFNQLFEKSQDVKHKLTKSMFFPEYWIVSHPVQINRLLLKRRNEISDLQQLLV